MYSGTPVAISVDADGNLQVSAIVNPPEGGFATETTLSAIHDKLPSALASDRLKVDGSGVTQPISAASLPLPTNAATQGTLANIMGQLPAALVGGRLSVDGSGVTQPVSAASLPLPSGAATQATLASILTALTVKNQALYNSAIVQATSGTADSGTLSVNGDAIGEGLIAEIEGISIWISAGSGVLSQISIVRSAVPVVLLRNEATVLNHGYSIYGRFTLLEGDNVRATVTSVTEGTVLNLHFIGRQYAAS